MTLRCLVPIPSSTYISVHVFHVPHLFSSGIPPVALAHGAALIRDTPSYERGPVASIFQRSQQFLPTNGARVNDEIVLSSLFVYVISTARTIYPSRFVQFEIESLRYLFDKI